MPKVTPEVIEQIKQLTGKVLQKEIARRLELSRWTVAKIQYQLGMPCHPGFTLTRQMERKILQLLERNSSAAEITEALGVPANAVRKIMLQHHHTRAKGSPGHKYKFSVKQLRDIARDLRLSEQRIAQEWGVTRPWLSRFRHSWWAGRRSKNNTRKAASAISHPKLGKPDDFASFTQKICDLCFDGKLPTTDDATFVAAMLASLAQTTLAGQPQAVLDTFAAGLARAVSALRESQNSQWKN